MRNVTSHAREHKISLQNTRQVVIVLSQYSDIERSLRGQYLTDKDVVWICQKFWEGKYAEEISATLKAYTRVPPIRRSFC